SRSAKEAGPARLPPPNRRVVRPLSEERAGGAVDLRRRHVSRSRTGTEAAQGEEALTFRSFWTRVALPLSASSATFPSTFAAWLGVSEGRGYCSLTRCVHALGRHVSRSSASGNPDASDRVAGAVHRRSGCRRVDDCRRRSPLRPWRGRQPAGVFLHP